MKKDSVFTAGLIFSFFILFLMIINTAFCLIKHYIIQWNIYIIPLAAFVVALLVTVIRKAPTWIKSTVPAVLAVCVFLYCSFFSFMGHTEYRVYEDIRGIEKYNERYEKTSELERFCAVDIEDYGSFTDINLYYYDCISIFSDRSRIVIASYTDEDFDKMKNELQVKNPDYTANVDGFDFAVSVTEAFPKSVTLSGFNKETKEIATIHYQNMDLDDIGTLEDFIRGWCGWNLIE